MKRDKTEIIPTRVTLLNRLRNWQDDLSWKEFFDVYWRLIYGVARKAGLADAEAQDVVQETLISVAKHMPTFQYDPSIGSFKGWLLNMTRWRIIAQFRKRAAHPQHHVSQPESTSTSTTERIPDPNAAALDAMWENEWQTNLMTAALEKIKRRLDPEKYQIFDFLVNKEWPPAKVSDRFGVSIEQVYQVKHRITEAIKSEVRRLEKEMT